MCKIFDLWDDGLYQWEDMFMNFISGKYKMLIHYVCCCGDEQAILYILDIYANKKLNVEITGGNKCLSIHFLCMYSSSNAINRMIDIYIERNLEVVCTWT